MSRFFDTLTFGPARRRRRMGRLLEQLDKMPAGAFPAGQGARTSHPSMGRPGLPGLRVIATLMVWVLLIGGVVYLARMGGHKSAAASPARPATGRALGQDSSHSNFTLPAGSDAYPTPGNGELLQRVLPAPAIPAGTGDYNFLATSKTGPVAYDPCRPIHYVIRDHGTPAGGDETIARAVAAVSEATGLRFINDGKTTEAPTAKRAAYQPVRYGNRWAPVLIAWSDAKETPDLGGEVVGLGGSVDYQASNQSRARAAVYVTGSVVLDAPDLTGILGTPNGSGVELAVVEHELGHLVGLAHVSDPTQIMNPYTTAVTSYGAGDRRGLARLGRGSCFPGI